MWAKVEGDPYGTLIRVLSGIADMVGRQLDGFLVNRHQERLGEGKLAHDVLFVAREQ